MQYIKKLIEKNLYNVKNSQFLSLSKLCKNIITILEELARKLKHNSNLVIAKMDFTRNEVDNINFKGFPTITFWPAGKKDFPIDFEKQTTLEGFLNFLKQHAGNSITDKNEDL